MRTTLAAAALLVAAAGAAGCEPSGSPELTVESTAPPSPQAAQDLVGPGCDAYVKKHASGPGSIASLADQDAAAAIEDHPDLTMLAKAISGDLNEQVDLVDELNGGEFTIFAPTDAAFAKLPQESVRALAEARSAKALTDLLFFHLAVGERSPAELGDQVETRGGEKLAIAQQEDRIRIAGQANVICGGLHTANATLYLIDSVLIPPTDQKP